MAGLAFNVRGLISGPLLVLLMGIVPFLSACGDDTAPGCRADSECRGDRICIAGTCQEPDDPNNAPNNDPNNDPNPAPNPNPDPDPVPNPDMNPDPDPGCFTDIDCPDGTFCELGSGSCEEGCRPGTCPDGTTCDFDTRECIGEGGCIDDAQCDDDEFCDEDGECAGGCREGGCPDGEVCDLDTRECTEVPCDGDGGCDDGQICDEGLCRAGCRDDNGCDDDEFCDETRCLPGCREGSCPDGQICDLDSRVCIVAPCNGDDDCDGGQICDDGSCRGGCREDVGCDDDQYCDDSFCVDGCREGGCPDGEVCDLDTRDCVEIPCDGDEACDGGQICDEGLCRAGCRDDNGCNDDEYCDEDQCLDGCREGGCPEGEACNLDNRECEVDLIEEPAIVVDPEEIDFGEVGQNVSVFRDLTIRNVGSEDLVVSDVRLQQNPSTGFQVIAPQNEPITLGPLEEVVYRVRFQPTFLQNNNDTRYGNTVVVVSNDPDGNVGVPLTGLGVPDPEFCLEFSDREVDFGFVAPDDISAETISLENCGNEPIEVTGLDLQGDDDVFTTVVGGGFPRTLDPGDDLNVIINYLPNAFEDVQASLIATTGEDIQAETILVGDGPGCPEADIQGRVVAEDENDFTRGTVRAVVGATVELTAEDSDDPAGGDLEFTWEITAPEDSMSLDIDPNLESESLTFAPDAPGTYEVTLNVVSDLSGIEACEPAVFRVVVPHVSIVVTWDNRSDVDLHLVRSDEEGEFSELGTGQNVNENACYFGNRNPDWGAEDDASDNPSYLVDDQNGFGPETILMPDLETDRSYQVAVRLAQRRSFGATEMTVTIAVGDDDPVEFVGEVEDQGDVFRPAIINGDGTIEALEVNP